MKKALIVGGSLSGLFAGVMLRSIGWDVEIHERSAGTLESRGGGIVVQPEVVSLFQQVGLDPEGPVGVLANERIFLADDGSVANRIELPQKQTSWNAIYAMLREAFPAKCYFQGSRLTAVHQTEDAVTATFEDMTTATGDMLIGADGASSTVRQLLFPSVRSEYAGYVAWRGMVPEGELDPRSSAVLANHFAFYELGGSHMLAYLVAADDLSVEPGKRRYNWVWYRKVDEVDELDPVLTDASGRRHAAGVPPGALAPKVEAELREAADNFLCFPLRSLVAATKQPFVHIISDISVRHMVQGRVALLGEAAFAARPHTASSTSKAATNVRALVEALQHEKDDVRAALHRWEPSQLKVGDSLIEYGKRLWERSESLQTQFH